MVTPDAAHPADAPCTVHGHRCKAPPDPILGVFHSHRFLGSGAFGRVYASKDSSNDDAAVALKVISKCTLGISSVARHALRSEIEIQRSVDHPNIVAMRNVHQDRLRIYLVLDLVGGPCLADVLSAHRPLSETCARVYFAHLCRGLHYLHTRQVPVLHRDVKPANILLSYDRSSAYLCDFGLAQRTEPGGAPTELMLVGTPNFLPPELLESNAKNPGEAKSSLHKPQMHPCPLAIDCYAAGVVLFIMLFGVAPFDGFDVPRTFRRIRAGRISFPSSVKISSSARNLIKLLLSRNPAARPKMSSVLKHPFLCSAGNVPWPVSIECTANSALSVDDYPSEAAEHISQERNGRAKNHVVAPLSRAKALPDDRRTEAVSRGFAQPPGSRLRPNVSSSFKLDSKAAAHTPGHLLKHSASLSGKLGTAFSPAPRPRDVAEQNDSSAEPIKCLQRRLHSDLSNNQRELRIDNLLTGRDNVYGDQVPNENFSAAANERSTPHCESLQMGQQRVASSTFSRETRSGSQHSDRGPSRPMDRWSDRQRKPDSSRSDVSDQGLSSRSHHRHNSISRCVALYNALLQKLIAGLRDAQVLLDSDSASSQGHKAAHARFQRVSRLVPPDDPNLPIMVDKWLDMSSSFGFATKLSDGRTGCCFNDSSIMFNWSLRTDLPDVAYTSANSRQSRSRQIAPRAKSTSGTESDGSSQGRNRHPGSYAPSRRYESIGHAQAMGTSFQSTEQHREGVGEKAKLLCKFREMLNSDTRGNEEQPEVSRDVENDLDNVSTAVGGPSSCSISFLAEENPESEAECTESLLKVRGLETSKLVHVRGWQRYKSPRAVAFRMSNDSIHIKIDVGSTRGENVCEEDFVFDARLQTVYYRATDGKAWECRLQDVAEFCFSKRFHVRLAFCSRVVSRFVTNQ